MYLENSAITLLPIGHILSGFAILLCLAMESYTLVSFSSQGRKVCGFAAHISGRNRRGKSFAMSFGEIGLFICRHIYLCKQLLLQINSCCQ